MFTERGSYIFADPYLAPLCPNAADCPKLGLSVAPKPKVAVVVVLVLDPPNTDPPLEAGWPNTEGVWLGWPNVLPEPFTAVAGSLPPNTPPALLDPPPNAEGVLPLPLG